MFYINSKCIHTLMFDAPAGGDHEGSPIFLKFDLKNKKMLLVWLFTVKKMIKKTDSKFYHYIKI